MIDLGSFGNISGVVLLGLFFKAFAIAFSAIYLLYAIVLTKQTEELNKTLIVQRSAVLFFISFSQIISACLLLGLAIFVV